MSNSVNEWITGLKKGDADAAQRLWDRYFKELVKFARRRLGAAPRQTKDEEDIALSVFDSFCRGAQAGRLSGVKDHHELWWTLLAITRRKVIDQVRVMNRQAHGEMSAQSETDIPVDPRTGDKFDLNLVLDESPAPELLMNLDDEWKRLLSLLRDDTLRRIACWRIEGYSTLEISKKLRILPRTVARKLSLIRSKWTEEDVL